MATFRCGGSSAKDPVITNYYNRHSQSGDISDSTKRRTYTFHIKKNTTYEIIVEGAYTYGPSAYAYADSIPASLTINGNKMDSNLIPIDAESGYKYICGKDNYNPNFFRDMWRLTPDKVSEGDEIVLTCGWYRFSDGIVTISNSVQMTSIHAVGEDNPLSDLSYIN